MALQIEGVAYLTRPSCGLPFLGASHDHHGKAAVSDVQPDVEPLGMQSSAAMQIGSPNRQATVEASRHDCH